MLRIIGIILIFIGCFNLYQYNKTMKENFYTKGTLTEFYYSPSRNRHYPIFRYVVNGVTYNEEYRGKYSNKEKIDELKNINPDEVPEKTKKFIKKLKNINFIEYEIGKEYKLVVNKNNPKEFWIADDGVNKGREYILIIIGSLFLVISFLSKAIKIIF